MLFHKKGHEMDLLWSEAAFKKGFFRKLNINVASGITPGLCTQIKVAEVNIKFKTYE